MAGFFDVGQAQDRMGQALGPALDRMAQQMPENPALDRMAQTQQQGFVTSPQQSGGPAFDPTAALNHVLSFGGYGGGFGGGPGGNSGPAFDPTAALNATFGQVDPFASRDYMMQSNFNRNQQGVAAEQQARADKAAQDAAQQKPRSGPAPSAAPGATPANLSPDVARWDGQVQQTFGDLGSWMPNAMLAIIQHESSGKPDAYNAAAPGGAWGLFQQLGINTNDPNAQFTAARQLAQEKLAGIQDSYAKNGINPDERTRARDLFLAWAGHFDYASGQPNPNSRDVGTGQTADQFLNEIMGMYDNIARGRQQTAPAGGNSGLGAKGLPSLTPGVNGSVMQEFGHTDYSEAHPSTYAYGNSYGLAGSQHPGVDWAVPSGTRTASPLAGTVSIAGGSGYYTDTMNNVDPAHSGEFMLTLDNGDQLILGHMSAINVQAGQRINAGDYIGASGGSDGAHIHVEYRQRQADGSYRIVDPRGFLGQ